MRTVLASLLLVFGSVLAMNQLESLTISDKVINLDALPAEIVDIVLNSGHISDIKKIALMDKLSNRTVGPKMEIRRNVLRLCGLEGVRLLNPAKAQFLRHDESLRIPPHLTPHTSFDIGMVSIECLDYVKTRFDHFSHITSLLFYVRNSSFASIQLNAFQHILNPTSTIKMVVIGELMGDSTLFCDVLTALEGSTVSSVAFSYRMSAITTQEAKCVRELNTRSNVEDIESINLLRDIDLADLLVDPNHRIKSVDLSYGNRPTSLSLLLFDQLQSVALMNVQSVPVNTTDTLSSLKIALGSHNSYASLLNPGFLPGLDTFNFAISFFQRVDHEKLLSVLILRKHMLKEVSLHLDVRSKQEDSFFSQLRPFISENSILKSLSYFNTEIFYRRDYLDLRVLKYAKNIDSLTLGSLFNADMIKYLCTFIEDPRISLRTLSLNIYSFSGDFNEFLLNVKTVLASVIHNKNLTSISITTRIVSGAHRTPKEGTKKFVLRLKQYSNMINEVTAELDPHYRLLFNGIPIKSYAVNLALDYSYWPENYAPVDFSIKL